MFKIAHTPKAHEAFASHFLSSKSALAQLLQTKKAIRKSPLKSDLGVDQTGIPVPEEDLVTYESKFRYAKTMDPTILICGHNSRDTRCGILGPLLREHFLSYVRGESRLPVNDERSTGYKFSGLRPVSPISNSKVALTSHIGGHAFAGNVVIYLPSKFKMASGRVSPLAGMGIWYGRVEPRHVWGIMEETVQKGYIIKELLTGAHEPGGRGVSI